MIYSRLGGTDKNTFCYLCCKSLCSFVICFALIAIASGVCKASDGYLWGMGRNGQGELGDGTTEVAVVIKYIENNPEKWSLPASWVIKDAIKEALPK